MKFKFHEINESLKRGVLMNSRERVIKTINHHEPDRVPVDFGATGQTGINASTLLKLRKTLNLKDAAIYVHEPFQILGYIDQDLQRALQTDVVGLWNPVNFLGFKNEGWKAWVMPDGTPVKIGGGFEYDVDSNGVTFVYPQGDRTALPSAKLPARGYFFDNINRAGDYDEDHLNAREDFKDAFAVWDDATAEYLARESKRLYEETDYAVLGNFGGGGFGDVAAIPGPYEKNPRGIRKIEDWLMAHILYPDYIKELFDMQLEVALKNLEIYRQAVGERIQIVYMSGTDFGSQNSEIISPDLYREFYAPYHKTLNDWVHRNTQWKTFYHCCGSIVKLLDDMVKVGVDILNPVQCSATGMDPVMLKEKYGQKLVFWGGGVDTQHTLPFGTPEEVREQVGERLKIFSKKGGFVFSSIHNVQGKVPVENLSTMFETLAAFNNGKHS